MKPSQKKFSLFQESRICRVPFFALLCGRLGGRCVPRRRGKVILKTPVVEFGSQVSSPKWLEKSSAVGRAETRKARLKLHKIFAFFQKFRFFGFLKKLRKIRVENTTNTAFFTSKIAIFRISEKLRKIRDETFTKIPFFSKIANFRIFEKIAEIS